MDEVLRKIEERLIAEFTIEILRGHSIDIDEWDLPDFSNDKTARKIQEDYAHWCIASKKLLVSDVVEPFSEDGFAASNLKAHLIRYVEDKRYRYNDFMKYLYCENNVDSLVSNIAYVTQYGFYKDVEDFNNIPIEILRESINPANVCVPIGLYILFVILVHSKVSNKQYNNLFTKIWFKYYNEWPFNDAWLRKRGYALKQDFANVLIF